MSEPRRRNDTSYGFKEAVELATKNGLILREVAPSKYRIEGLGWFKELFPQHQRIFCPDKAKQGPFVAMKIGKRWDLVSVVKASVAAMRKAPSKKAGGVPPYSGESEDSQQALALLINAVEAFECHNKQFALRDLMTDLRHVTDRLGLDFHKACDGSYAVYLEEKEEEAGTLGNPPTDGE